MGIVHAKSESYEDKLSTSEAFNISGVQTRVDKIHVNGLGRTKDDFIVASVKDLFVAEDFNQVILQIHKICTRFEAQGIFKNVGVFIDTSRGHGSTPDGLVVTFHVQEQKRLSGGINTLVGNNEGSVVLGTRLPNVLGRAEKLQAEYAYGSKRSSGFNATLTKPFLHPTNPFLTGVLFHQSAEVPWSGFGQVDHGALLELSFESGTRVKHNLRWEGVWRELKLLPMTKSFDIREEMGHSVKSSLKHSLNVDHRDANVLPTRGLLLRLHQELAGLGGDIGFLKNEIELQANLKLPFNCVLQGSFAGGMMHARDNDKTYNICDRFFLGGPLTLRGFEIRGAGPHHEGCATGSEMYWASALHLYTPLPFYSGHGVLGDRFRLHAFANGGNCANFNLGEYQKLFESLFHDYRWAIGTGLVIQIGHVARVEINYCLPIHTQKGDRTCHGLQFGVGVTYL